MYAAHDPISVVFAINFKSRAAASKDIKSAIKDSTNKNIPSIEVPHIARDGPAYSPFCIHVYSASWPLRKFFWRTSATRSTTRRSRKTL